MLAAGGATVSSGPPSVHSVSSSNPSQQHTLIQQQQLVTSVVAGGSSSTSSGGTGANVALLQQQQQQQMKPDVFTLQGRMLIRGLREGAQKAMKCVARGPATTTPASDGANANSSGRDDEPAAADSDKAFVDQVKHYLDTINKQYEQFEANFDHWRKNQRERSLELRMEEKRPTSCVLQIIIHHNKIINERNKPLVSAAFKLLLLVEAGVAEMILIKGIDEEWRRNGGQFDFFDQSIHEVYRRLTSLLSSQLLMQTPSSKMRNLRVFQNFDRFLEYIQSYSFVFLTPCRNCDKILKDFLPPIVKVGAPNNEPRAFVHEACK